MLLKIVVCALLLAAEEFDSLEFSSFLVIFAVACLFIFLCFVLIFETRSFCVFSSLSFFVGFSIN